MANQKKPDPHPAREGRMLAHPCAQPSPNGRGIMRPVFIDVGHDTFNFAMNWQGWVAYA